MIQHVILLSTDRTIIDAVRYSLASNARLVVLSVGCQLEEYPDPITHLVVDLAADGAQEAGMEFLREKLLTDEIPVTIALSRVATHACIPADLRDYITTVHKTGDAEAISRGVQRILFPKHLDLLDSFLGGNAPERVLA